MRLLVILVLALIFSSISSAATDSNWGEQGGGYTQLPACNVYWYEQGTVLHVQGYFWRCVRYPYHWVIVG